VSADLLLLLLCGAAAAYGFWASLKGAPRAHPAAWIAAVLFLLVGMHGALVVTVHGAGEILPGHQLNPDLQAFWAAQLLQGELFAPHPGYLHAAWVGLLFALIAKPGRAALLRVLPAAVAFLLVYVAVAEREGVSFEEDSSGGRSAFVTMFDGGRLLFSIGDLEDVFVPVLHEHEAGSPPPKPRIHWRGEVVTFTTRGGKPYFAFDAAGNATGWLPSPGETWPGPGKAPADSVAYQRKVSAARVEVARLLKEHGE